MLPTIYEDCTAVIMSAKDGGGMARTKHLGVRIELTKQALQEQKFQLKYVNTKQMIADGLTKVLKGDAFIKFADNLFGMPMVL